jgi:CheY-like chemotaxis protein
MSRDDPIHILLAEDDPDDRLLTRRALGESPMSASMTTVEDGAELMRYLRGEGEYRDRSKERWPDLVLLDLNMPGMDGREALREIKTDAELRRLPVVVLTTSEAERDVLESYNLGVNAFVTKPVDFDDLADAMQALGEFWFDFATLPPEHDADE